MHLPITTTWDAGLKCATAISTVHSSGLIEGIIMKKWQCIVCGYIYDEAIGDPEHDLPAGTRWEDVPESWSCPDCGVTKGDFEMIRI